ncbi:MAG: helix-turn-helix domain-containing protein [Mycobacterium sp.]
MEARIESDDCGRKIAVEPCTEPCAIERGMRVLGGKWTGSILWHLKDEPVRFNDLARMVGGASKKMIAERLTHLEAHGLIDRRVLETRPLGVAYQMTTKGETALRFLEELRRWSEEELGPTDGKPADDETT